MQTSRFTIRTAVEEDAEALSTLAMTSFSDTFGYTYTPDDLSHYLATTYSPTIQKQEILSNHLKVFVVFEKESTQMMGYAMLNPSSIEVGITGPHPLEIKRLYIAKEYHGTGAAHLLMEVLFKSIDECGAKTIWLGVWESNFRAHNFYQGYGFVKVGQHVFTVGNHQDVDYLFQLNL